MATETKKRTDFSELDVVGQSTWQHGRGQFKLADLAAFMDAEFLDTRIPGQVIPAPARHQIATDLNGELVDMIYWPVTDTLYGLVRGNTVSDNKLVEWDNTGGTWSTVGGASALLQAAGSAPTSLGIFSVSGATSARTATDYLVISRNQPGTPASGALSYIYTTDGASFVALGTNPDKATNFAVFKERLAYDSQNNLVVLRPDPTSATNEIQLNNLGSALDPITNLVVLGELLVVLKSTQAYAIYLNPDGASYSTKVVIDYPWGRSNDNGKAAFVYQGQLYFNILHSIWSFNGTSIRSVGPDLGAHEPVEITADASGTINVPTPDFNYQGMDEDKRGPVVGMTGNANWIFAALDGANTDTIVAYGGTGWHELTQPSANANGGVWFFPTLFNSGILRYPTLWYRDGELSGYLILPDGTDNRWDYSSTDYETTGTPRLTTSWIDMDLAEVWKDWLEFHTVVDIPNTSCYLTVEYQVDYDTSWYSLGNTFGNHLHFPDGSPGFTRARAIRFRITFENTSSAAPRLRQWFAQFITRPDARYGWRMTLRAETNQQLHDRTISSLDSAEIARRLYELRSRGGPLRWDDGRTLSGKHNYLRNPGFEGWSSGAPVQWNSVSTPTLSANAQYKTQGVYSLKVVASGAGMGVDQFFNSIPATQTYTGIIRIKVVSGTVRFTFGGVNTDISAPAANTNEWDDEGLDDWTRVATEVSLSQGGSTAFRIQSLGGAATFYLDACEIREGEDDLSPFIGEGESRCRAVTKGTFHNTVSYRPPFWLVYMSGISENFFSPDTYLDASEDPTLTYDTRFTVELREATP